MMIQRKVDKTMNGWAGFDESGYLDFLINLWVSIVFFYCSSDKDENEM